MAAEPPCNQACSVVTDRDGRIVELNDAAAHLLKITSKGLERHPRHFGIFFDTSRAAIMTALSTASGTTSDRILAVLRARERGPKLVVMTVQEASDGYLEWTITPTVNGS